MAGWTARSGREAKQPGVLLQALNRDAEASGFHLGKRPHQRSDGESPGLRLARLLTVVTQARQREHRQSDGGGREGRVGCHQGRARRSSATGRGLWRTRAITRCHDAGAIAKIVGHPVPVTGDVAKVTIGMEGQKHDTTVGASMRLITWAAFSSSGELTAIDHDFILRADDVRPALMAFRKGRHPRRGPLSPIAFTNTAIVLRAALKTI
ncbi:DUF1259 domain-containing protein [Dyella japonica]|uniref:Transposase n=1 Tax=Dyella japonica TaxID=231455 RepID=A0ABV2JWC0_9GAMM